MQYVTRWPWSNGHLLASENESPTDLTALPLKKILVIGWGGLGDAIHLIPSLQLIRQSYPQAELHVMNGFEGFFKNVTPWIDVAWPALRPGLKQNVGVFLRVRRERFDAVFTFSWRAPSVCAAWCSGAPIRVGRRAPRKKAWHWQRLALTQTVDHPWWGEPMFSQQLRCMGRAGLGGRFPAFHYQVLPEWLMECGISASELKSYIHISPFTSEHVRDLPLAQCLELLEGLNASGYRVAISCDESEQAIKRLNAISAQLSFAPWKVFAGTLKLHHLVALIQGAKLHLSGDTGSLHIARMTQTPSVSWFKLKRGHLHWAPKPEESLHKFVVSDDGRADALHGIETKQLLNLIECANLESKSAGGGSAFSLYVR